MDGPEPAISALPQANIVSLLRIYVALHVKLIL